MIYKSFIRRHLDYGYITYGKGSISRIPDICRCHSSMLRQSLYIDLGLESLQSRWWYGKVIFFYKIINGLTPKYVFDIIPVSNDSCYNTRAQSKSKCIQFYTRTKTFINNFSLFRIKEWNQLDAKIRNLSSVFRFKKIAFNLF